MAATPCYVQEIHLQLPLYLKGLGAISIVLEKYESMRSVFRDWICKFSPQNNELVLCGGRWRSPVVTHHKRFHFNLWSILQAKSQANNWGSFFHPNDCHISSFLGSAQLLSQVLNYITPLITTLKGVYTMEVFVNIEAAYYCAPF